MMMAVKDAALFYETLLMSPGMNDPVRIPLSVKRKTLMMLAKIIEQGANGKEVKAPGIISVMDNETVEELNAITATLLEKGGLSELNRRLNELDVK